MAKSAAVNPSETPLDSDSLDALENPAIATEDSVPVAVAIDTDARRILAEKQSAGMLTGLPGWERFPSPSLIFSALAPSSCGWPKRFPSFMG